ncbi:A24 family peptidase [Anaerobacillus arseniciselenatis]|uniref:A24 family peptidase n=1 Tax=Anaerobacillus arseniciselenatis TaxID=85682 RepID=UPI001FE0D9D6|nr:prepilin peptidase [Anaerobacillus arseniciselenatis]
MIAINLFLITVLAVCVVTDLKSRKIYNKVIFPSLVIAFIANFFIYGFSGVTTAVIGFFLGLAILIIPFLLGGMGAGDVKLLAFIGALKGTSFVFITAIYMAIIGAIIALAIVVLRKGWAKNWLYFLYGRKCGLDVPLTFDNRSMKATYPYGVAIALGAVFTLVFQELPFL